MLELVVAALAVTNLTTAAMVWAVGRGLRDAEDRLVRVELAVAR